MASIRQLNQGASFWDFVNGFSDPEGVFNNHPFGFHPPPPPPGAPDQRRGGPPAPPQNPEAPEQTYDAEKDAAAGAPNDRTPEGSDTEQEQPPSGPSFRGRGRGGPHHPHSRGGYRGQRGGHHHGGFGCGRRGRGGPPPPFAFGGNGEPWAANLGPFGEILRGFAPRDAQASGSNANNNEGDFVPPVDVFDTETAFVVHVSLAGAKKEDIAVAWDPETSELSITGVIHRPGNEELLKTLALDERKVGAFERKVRLGSRAAPAKVEVDGIAAKLEEGVLRIDVPKEDRDFVEVKKVDVL